MTQAQQTIIDTITIELINMLRKDFQLSLRESCNIVYNSKTFSHLEDCSSGEYLNGSLYVYDDLLHEIKTGDLIRVA